MPNENIGTVECPIKGCREIALLRKNSRGWLYSNCPAHGNVQSGMAAMQDWMRDHAKFDSGSPESDTLPLPSTETEPIAESEHEPIPASVSEPKPAKDDLDSFWE